MGKFGFIGGAYAWLLSDICQASGVCLLACCDADFRKCCQEPSNPRRLETIEGRGCRECKTLLDSISRV